MKSMSSNFINISANNSGDFVVKLETDKATITTYFKDLPTSCPGNFFFFKLYYIQFIKRKVSAEPPY